MSTSDQDKQKIHRRKHKNSRFGCQQCRQRRIKCDETLPSCGRCNYRKVRCGYMDYTEEQKRAVIENQQQQQWPVNQRQNQYNYQYEQPMYQPAHHHMIAPVPYQQYNMRYAILPPMDQSHYYQPEMGQYQHVQQYQFQSFTPQPVINYRSNLISDDDLSNSLQSHQPPSINTGSIDSPLEYSTNTSSFSSDSSPAADSNKQLFDSYIHPIEDLARKFTNSLTSNRPQSSPSTATSSTLTIKPIENIVIPPSFNSDTQMHELPLIPHKFYQPQYDLQKFPEFMGETISSLFSRVFIFSEIFYAIKNSFSDIDLFHGVLLRGTAFLLPRVPQLSRYFLKYRVECINIIRKNSEDLNDSNSLNTLHISSYLYTTTCFFEGSTYKDFFALAVGPGVILKLALENPDRFPETIQSLRLYASSFIFTTKYVWFPPYKTKALYEFYDVFIEFGEEYIHNNASNEKKGNGVSELLKNQYDDVQEFFETTFELLENEILPDNVVKFPIDKLVDYVKRGLAIMPSEVHTLGSRNTDVEKAFYVLVFTLAEILKFVLVDCSYIFTFALNGFYLMYPFDRVVLVKGMKDEKLIWFLNYSCRIVAFLVRRHAYLLRNTVLNDPIPSFMELKDRLKTRALDIHEVYITSFKDTVIKKWNYPSESRISKNLQDTSSDPATNYYASSGAYDFDLLGEEEDDADINIDLTNLLMQSLGNNEIEDFHPHQPLDFVNDIVPETGLLKQDYDPTLTDPIFKTEVIHQFASLDFIDKYIEDRRIIMQMGSSQEMDGVQEIFDEEDDEDV